VKTKNTLWEGKNGKLNAISKTPVSDSQEHFLVTVLFPANNSVANEKSPEVKFDNGIISISDGENIDEKILFKKKVGGWNLHAVNNEENLTFSNGSERTINPFREMIKEIGKNNLPSWFFPVGSN
jgi:hypothetical protein